MTATTSSTRTDAPDAPEVRQAAAAAAAAEYFAAKLRHETDPADVAAARAAGENVLVLDVRSDVAWDQGHLPGAQHVPSSELLDRLDELPPVDQAPRLVVYCWGPGCNASTKAALVLARAGYSDVQEMIGGFEYWAREGLAIEAAGGRYRLPVDELVAPRPLDGDRRRPAGAAATPATRGPR